MNLPIEIQQVVLDTFIHHRAYGQFATVNSKGVPSVRTVHFHLHEMDHTILISSNIQSEKWHHIDQGQTDVSGCYWHKDKGIQLRFTAKAKLISQHTHPEHELLTQMWNKIRPEVRTTYILNDKNIPLYRKNIDVDPEPHSPSHGVIVCDPTCWDLFYESREHYRFGKRHIYHIEGKNKWAKKDVSSLHEKDILLYDK